MRQRRRLDALSTWLMRSKSLDLPDMQPEAGGFLDGLCTLCGKLRQRLPPRNSVCSLEGRPEFALLTQQRAVEMRKIGRLSGLGAILALAFGLVGGGAGQAQNAPQTLTDYPNRQITAIIPFAAGSASDVVSRILFAKMSKSMGQTIVVENRPGAGGNNGTADAAKAAPDGYTILGSGSGPMAANVTLYKQLGYDPQKDFIVISPFAAFTIVVAASNKLPVNTLQELIAYGKEHPGLNYGSVGIGSSQHLAGEYFSQITGVKMTHVPYKNIGQYVPDMIAGDVPLGFQWYPNVSAAINAKGAKALAVAGTNRLDTLPDTPTVKEAGLPDYIVSGWFALSVPKGTPDAIVQKLNDEVKIALADPDLRARFQQQGAETYYLPADQTKKFIADEVVKYHDIITKAGIAQIE
jgi:tripartite-type tricarboxylate transporter receptor subunit TctC